MLIISAHYLINQFKLEIFFFAEFLKHFYNTQFWKVQQEYKKKKNII